MSAQRLRTLKPHVTIIIRGVWSVQSGGRGPAMRGLMLRRLPDYREQQLLSWSSVLIQSICWTCWLISCNGCNRFCCWWYLWYRLIIFLSYLSHFLLVFVSFCSSIKEHSRELIILTLTPRKVTTRLIPRFPKHPIPSKLRRHWCYALAMIFESLQNGGHDLWVLPRVKGQGRSGVKSQVIESGRVKVKGTSAAFHYMETAFGIWFP